MNYKLLEQFVQANRNRKENCMLEIEKLALYVSRTEPGNELADCEIKRAVKQIDEE